MTDRLTEIEQSLERATPGPWTIRSLDWTDDNGAARLAFFKYVGDERKYFPAFDVPEVSTLGDHECGGMELHNAEFIKSAPTDIAYLLGEVKRLKQESRNMLERAARICDTWHLLFPDCDETFIGPHQVSDALATEIRKQKELL